MRSAGPRRAALHHAAQRLRRQFFDRVLGEVHDPVNPLPSPLTAKDVRRRLKTARSTVAGFLSELEDKGFLDPAEAAAGGRGRPPKAWKPTDREDDGADVLPTAAEIFSGGAGDEMDKFPPPKSK